MPRIVLSILLVLLVNQAHAQGRGGNGGGSGRSAPAGGPRLSQSHPGVGRGFGRHRDSSLFPWYYGFGYPEDLSPDDASNPYEYEPQPGIIQPPAPGIVSQPPVVGHPVITEYPQPVTGPSARNSQPFGIVLKDGSILSAVAVVSGGSDNMLLYVDPEERSMRISMHEVDRAATLKLNRERNLTLALPSNSLQPRHPADN